MENSDANESEIPPELKALVKSAHMESGSQEGLLSRRGRPPTLPEPVMSFERELTPEDIARLESGERALQTTRQELTIMREKHRLCARMIAEGLSATDAALASGYTSEYVTNVLRDDPAFQELVAHYRERKDSIFEEAQRKLATLGMTAAERLQERLDDDDSANVIPTKELTRIVEKAFDRSIAPSKSAQRGSGDRAPSEGLRSLSFNLNFSEPPKNANIRVIEGEVSEVNVESANDAEAAD